MSRFFVPAAQKVDTEAVQKLTQFLRRAAAGVTADGSSNGGGVVVLTGAGVSTASGIPDYRSPKGSYSVGHKPITHQEFIRRSAWRKRYWARSLIGWKYFDSTQPNVTHHAIKALQDLGCVCLLVSLLPHFLFLFPYLHFFGRFAKKIVTQNVDGLHGAAGSKGTIELHGRNGVVKCLGCGGEYSRRSFQEKMMEVRPRPRACCVCVCVSASDS